MLKLAPMAACALVALLCRTMAIAQHSHQANVIPVNLPHLIGRSDIVLGRPNLQPSEALPLGNGRLGIAVWSADGLTAQLNRADTLPYRLSTGQVLIPGLAALTSASDYAGRLNLYDGAFEEHGGGMAASVYVQPGADVMIVDVSGADPAKPQTAILKLWEPRSPVAAVNGSTGTLAESWFDNENPGASGRPFGSLSAITVEGQSVVATVTDARTITIRFSPQADGRFRVIVASPHYEGGGAAKAQPLAAKALQVRDPEEHLAWWHNYWHHARFMKVSSPDGVGDYMENLRAIYLFSAAAESGGEFPGSQAGVGDLFSSARDQHQWDPAAFWHWNLRMQVAANLSAGLPELNAPYFRLYRENLANIERWTAEHLHGAPGICVPETMRFNGAGIEYERWDPRSHAVTGWNCDLASGPYYNARTLSTGAEVSLWIWQHYLATGDGEFLKANFPVMADSARFLLSYEKPGQDGLLHTSPSNAHETRWDALDPTTDISARQALYQATIEAARTLATEPDLVQQMQAAIARIPTFPRIHPDAPAVLLPTNSSIGATDVIADSYKPGDPIHNVENIGLEPVWPYDRIGDTSPLFALALQTFASRPNQTNIDWSFDPVQAARLHLGAEVGTSLLRITQANQNYINGFAKWGGDVQEFYVEQIANVALGLQEALVQDYDGVIRIAPAIPPGWNFDGGVAVRFGSTVYVQVRNGIPRSVAIQVERDQQITLRNPWPGEAVLGRLADSKIAVADASSDPILHFPAKAGKTYLIQRASSTKEDAFEPVDAVPSTSYRKLGKVQIGLEKANQPLN